VVRRSLYILAALSVTGLAILAFLVQKGAVPAARVAVFLRSERAVSPAMAVRVASANRRVAMAEAALRGDPATPYKWCALSPAPRFRWTQICDKEYPYVQH